MIFFGNDDSVDDNDGAAVDELISKFGLANTTHTHYTLDFYSRQMNLLQVRRRES